MPTASHAKPTATHAHSSGHLLRWVIGFGWAGLFVISAIDASLFPLPLPGSADLLLLVLVTHKPQQWWVLALVAIAGAIVGGYFSYRLAAKGGEALLERYVPRRFKDRLTGWVRHHPVLSIGLPALLPPPMVLTPFVIAAGALQMPKKTFLWTFSTFRATRYLLVAWLAQHYGHHLLRLWHKYFGESDTPVIWFFVVVIAAGIGIVVWQIKKKKISFKN
jgi:membrane protein YqaA with SNARE-associated domain